MKRALITLTIILLAACGDNAAMMPDPICGDGVVNPGEVCDDGNDVDTDMCSNTCEVPAGCGDGIVNFNEACDDGNKIEGDGCENNCTQSFCGNGVKGLDEECDDGNVLSGDGCDANCTPTACGNGVKSAPEVCDDGNAVEGDGCDTNCTVSACGNGVEAGTEQCDDMNTVTGDGCSGICTTETAEIEPNEDGMVATGAAGILGNDFATAAPDANGAISANATLIGALTPAGDEDIYKLTNTFTTPVRVRIDTWNLATGFGINVSCGTSINTGIQIKAANGTTLFSNDSRTGTTGDNCAGFVFDLAAGASVYAQIMENGDNAVVASYALTVTFTPSVCGDMAVGPGEQCDDGNTANGDGCTMTCQIEGAVSEVEPNEDGTPQTGGSGVNGNDFNATNPTNNGLISNDITIVGSLSPTGDEDIFAFTNTRPNPVVVTFDVWSLNYAHGIGVACDGDNDTALVIRDSAGASLASNDDRVTNDNCSKVSFSLFPGETRFAHLVEYGDNLAFNSYALVIKYANVVCGDTMVGLGEQCDDGNMMSGDGCSATCQVEPFCGDNILQPSEQCDDGNMNAGDNCSPTCQVEGGVAEVEPNEDGTPQTGGSTTSGNDFGSANPDANGAFTASTRIVGKITPAGDEDIYAFRNTGTGYVTAQFDVWNNAPTYGIGVPCGTSIDTGMHIRDATGTSLAVNDDRNSSADRCSTITYTIAPGQTVYAHVSDYGDTDQIASYTLEVVYNTIPCGDGIMQIGEQCDDSNTNNGDGCSSTCTLEDSFTETEPNDDGTVATGATGITGNDFSSAAANGPITTSKRVIGKLGVAGDEDVFRFTNPTSNPIQARFDVWNLAPNFGIGVACGTSIDVGLHIRDAAGASLASNDDRNGATDRCPGLTFTILPGASVYAHVVEQGDNAAVPSGTGTGGYVINAVYTPIVCGDGTVGPTEQCDDSNTNNGDGCSSTCQFEVVCGNGLIQTGEVCDDANTANNDGCSATCQLENVLTEVEPNNSQSEAAGNAVQVTGNAYLQGAITPSGDVDRYQLVVGTATTVRFEAFTTWGDCSTATLDLRLFDNAGASLVTDLTGSGINQCGAVTLFLAAGTYQVQIEERGNNATVASYLLQVAFQTNGGSESEPNETSAAADAITMNEVFVLGDHMMLSDVDVYAITVPGGARIRAEIIEGDMTETCESNGIDARLTLFDSTGAQVAEDNDDGRGSCSLIDGTGTSPADAGARNTSLAPKTFYLMVRSSAFATGGAAQFAYRLQVTLR